MSDGTNDYVSVVKAARELQVSKHTIYRWVSSGKIIGKTFADFLCIPKTEVERLKAERAPATAEALRD